MISRFFFFMSMLLLLTSCFRVPTSAEPGKSIKLIMYAKMPPVAQECSGIVLQDDGILFLNDGGDSPTIYKLSRDGKDSLDSYRIKGTVNRDWEALTIYKDELIVGDFGNNLGNRKDLTIYHIDLKTKKLKDSTIFAYPEQKAYDDPKHNYDCEAIVIKDDEYMIFSKNRGNKNSNIYKASVGSSDFKFVDSIALEGMVTAATYHEESDSYVLIGYQVGLGGFKNSLAIVREVKDEVYEVTNVFNIGPAEQFEALTHLEGNRFLMASELGFLGKGRHLYIVEIDGL